MEHGSGRRRTGRLVRATDRLAGVVITLGGLAVLASMLAICVFLVGSAAPLFGGGDAERDPGATGHVAGALPQTVIYDETGEQAMLLNASGRAAVLGVRTGRVWGEVGVVEAGAPVGAIGVEPGTGGVTAGFGGGAIGSGEVRSGYALIAEHEPGRGESGVHEVAGERAEALARRARFGAADERVVGVEDIASGTRVWELAATRAVAAGGDGDASVVAVAGRRVSSRERVAAAVLADGTAYVASVRSTRRLDGGPGRERVTRSAIELELGAEGELPAWVFLTGTPTGVVLVWEDGRYQRYTQAAGDDAWGLVEGGTVLAHGGRVTTAGAALGGNTVLVGDSEGRISSWKPARRGDAGTPDGMRMTRTTRTTIGRSPVRSIGVGRRDRTVSVGLENGTLALHNMTSGKRVAQWMNEEGGAVIAAGVAPAVDSAVGVFADGTVRVWRLDPGHPEATWASLFGKVHYEGYDGAAYVYQSTGSQDSEPKLSLMPLIWGTLKATVVAMLFAVPIAVLGAIYTSEFLHPSWRKTVKPTIELMASLPSVVLGFIAAVLVAPLIAKLLPEVILAMGVVPVAVVAGAGVWRMVPLQVRRRMPTAVLTGAILAAMVVGASVAAVTGGAVESLLFAREGGGGDLRAWLDGNFGGTWPGWFMALVGPAAVVVFVLWATACATRWNAFTDSLTRMGAGLAQLVALAVQVGAVLGVAALGAGALTGLGFDPRDSIFGAFSQRNTLVVGVIMGVAVIPIIYTIAEDALTAVPRSLRFASTGCGATAWQTAVRVVLPVAGSGIFSACMIGLGRAVGETMIVLMATGNTPEMSLNIFGGFRTLAANIAVELPEAPRGGTHYRVLFLCGLVLFAMTLVINTTAELVRQRFRKRNAAL